MNNADIYTAPQLNQNFSNQNYYANTSQQLRLRREVENEMLVCVPFNEKLSDEVTESIECG